MKTIQKILIPTDFSDHAAQALTWGLSFAARSTKVMLFHTYEFYPVSTSLAALPYTGDLMAGIAAEAQAELDKVKTSAVAQLRAALPKEIADTCNIECKVVRGVAYHEIVKEAAAGGYDLIVMGTHGRTGMKHALIGSVAERVVRLAPCPVLTVRGQATTLA